MSNINSLVYESFDNIEEAGVLRGAGRGLVQGAVGSMGGLVGGGAAAATSGQIGQLKDRLAELRGERPKGMTIGRGLGALGAGALGAIPIVGGAVNAIQGARAGYLRGQLNKANAGVAQQARPSAFGPAPINAQQ